MTTEFSDSDGLGDSADGAMSDSSDGALDESSDELIRNPLGTVLRDSLSEYVADDRASHTKLADLGRLLYDRALVRRDAEDITDPRGNPIGWLLDTRIPMLDGDSFRAVGEVLAHRLRDRGVTQVAGFGFGAYALVCAVIGASGRPALRAGFIRHQRKAYGRSRLVEGPIVRSEPVVLLDDILNSGRSASRAVSLLESDGFEVAGMMTLFNFTWSGGRSRLEARGLWVDSLLDLNLREDPVESGVEG